MENSENISENQNTADEQPKKRRRRRKSAPAAVTAYVDTEFNAFDYYGQNGGHQEILQIGAVIMKGEKMLDGFRTFCALRRGHVLSKRSMKLTGIRPEDIKKAPAFPEALEMFNEFLEKHEPAAIFAYGSEDRLQLINTARMHDLKKEDLRFAERIEDNMKQLSGGLNVRKRSNLTLSVRDLCEICGVEEDKAHDAYNDAMSLALCSEKIRRGHFDAENVRKLIDKKSWMSNYRMARRIKDCRESVILEDEDIAPIRAMIETLKDEGQYPGYQLQAIYDDLLMISGRMPEDSETEGPGRRI